MVAVGVAVVWITAVTARVAMRVTVGAAVGLLVHVPADVGPCPARCSPALQAACGAHAKPLLVPKHAPVRYCPVPQLALSQAAQVPGLLPARHCLVPQLVLGMGSHWKPLVVPLQVPVRREPVGQFTLTHTLHVKLLVVPEHDPTRRVGGAVLAAACVAGEAVVRPRASTSPALVRPTSDARTCFATEPVVGP